MTALTYTLACHYCPFSKQEFNMRAKLTLLSVLKTSLVGAQHKKLVYLLAGPGRVYYVWSGLADGDCCQGRVPGLTG